MSAAAGAKSAFVSIVGRPSSGKSTLLNRMCGNKVSIVSDVPQTTRNKIRGIVNRPKGQLVFIDTPGFHASARKFNRYMKELVLSSLQEVDLILYVVDLTRPSGEEEEALVRLLFSAARGGTGAPPVVAALNKIDCPELHERKRREQLSAVQPPPRIVRVSALTGVGVEELLDVLFELAPEGEPFYPSEFYTDQDPEFRIAETIREKAILHTRQEVPHAIYVEIADAEMRGEALWVRAFIHVERESQRGIVVGRAGAIIRQIRLEAEQELSVLFPYRVRLDLRVKVTKKWRSRDALLRRLTR